MKRLWLFLHPSPRQRCLLGNRKESCNSILFWEERGKKNYSFVNLQCMSWIEISKIPRTFNTISKIVDNLSGQNWKSMSLKISGKKCSHLYKLYIWYYRGLFSFMSSQPDCCAFFMQLNSSCVYIRVLQQWTHF